MTVAVVCPSLTVGTISNPSSNVPPDVAATVLVNIITAANLFSTVSCPITAISLVLSSDDTTAYTGTMVTVTTAGLVQLNTNKHETISLKVKYTYNSVTALTNAFTSTSVCPAATSSAISTTVYTNLVPNAAAGSNT